MKPIPDMGLFFRTEVGNLVADNEYWATLVGGETAPNPSLVAVTPSASVPVPDYSAYGEEHELAGRLPDPRADRARHARSAFR